MMNLEIRNVADNATDEERVVLYVLADCNLNDYLLFDLLMTRRVKYPINTDICSSSLTNK